MLIRSLLLACALAAQDFDGGAPAKPVELPEPPKAASGAPAPAPANVILIMWDGVRREEFFSNKPDPVLSTDADEILPRFWKTLAGEGTVWGEPGGSEFRIANIAAVSLPAYQSIFAGYAQPCLNNKCGRITVETFPERIKRELALPAEEVAVFASWNTMAQAVEHQAGTITVDVGPAGKDRADADTWNLAMAHLAAKKPRFLYVHLVGSDNEAHAGDYPAYLRHLRAYDEWLAALVKTLDGMGDYGANTTLLLSTDHGRGLGQDWKNHNLKRPSAFKVFLYARGPRAARGAKGGAGRTHADIRPTVETLLGLAPFTCAHCGSALPEAVKP
jgi:hypothetical protein